MIVRLPNCAWLLQYCLLHIAYCSIICLAMLTSRDHYVFNIMTPPSMLLNQVTLGLAFVANTGCVVKHAGGRL